MGNEKDCIQRKKILPNAFYNNFEGKIDGFHGTPRYKKHLMQMSTKKRRVLEEYCQDEGQKRKLHKIGI